jgi:hypothetical protein
MNKQEQKQFINDMLVTLEESIIKNIDRIPEEWDGRELRQYLVDKAEELNYMPMDRQRKKDYANDIMIYNL